MELKEQYKPFDFDPERFTNRRWTYDELLVELPETNVPIELWEGQFVMSPSPSFFHQELIDRFHDTLNLFAEQCERLLMTAVLLLFGGALANGILDRLTWQAMAFGLVFVLLVRPAAGMLSMMGSALPWRERLAISGFGVRGIGSFYYLAFALNQGWFPMKRELWATVSFVVLLSILVHGLAATSMMQYLDSRRKKIRQRA